MNPQTSTTEPQLAIKPNHGWYLLTLTYALLIMVIFTIGFIAGIFIMGSSVVEGAIISLLSAVVILLHLNDFRMPTKTELTGTFLSTNSLVGKKSFDLTKLSKVKVIKISYNRYSSISKAKLLEFIDNDGHKIYIQPGYMDQPDRSQLWSKLQPYVAKDNVQKPANLDHSLQRIGIA